jgi:copper transporter 1
MDMTNSMNTTLMRAMNTALHFKPLGDTLLFSSWMPASGGAVAGACIGLFILAMLERWVDAMRMLLGMRWAAAARTDAKAIKDKGNAGKKKRPVRLHAPPFVAAHDVPRGALYALQSLLGYVFMLVAMCVFLFLCAVLGSDFRFIPPSLILFLVEYLHHCVPYHLLPVLVSKLIRSPHDPIRFTLLIPFHVLVIIFTLMSTYLPPVQ